MIVRSRHQGAGIVSVCMGNNTSTISQANAYSEIKYWGPQNSGNVIHGDAYKVYISADGKTGYLFWQYNDYSNTEAYVISSDFTISNGTWMTSIGSGYGSLWSTTQINSANTATYSTYVKDIGNSSNTTFAYSKSGMNYGDYTWLAGWNGYELRAVNKSQFAQAHSHPYLPLAGGTMTGGLTFANNTWNLVGDDAYMGDHNIGGAVCFVGANGGTKIVLCNKSNQGDYAYFGYEGGNILTNKTIAANITGTCATAAKLGRSGNTGNPMTFNWSGKGGQPTWLWGGEDGTNMYVYNPSNFSVNWATNAGNGVESSGSGYIRFKCGVQICWGSSGAVTTSSGTNNFPVAFNSATYGVTMNAFNKKVDYGITITNKTTTYFSWGKNGAAPNGDVWIAVGT